MSGAHCAPCQHPVLVLRPVERVDVEQHVPVRVARARNRRRVVRRHRPRTWSASCQKLYTSPFSIVRQRDAVVGVQHVQDRLVVGLYCGSALSAASVLSFCSFTQASGFAP